MRPQNGASRPGGHYWGYYPGALSLNQVAATQFKIGHVVHASNKQSVLLIEFTMVVREFESVTDETGSMIVLWHENNDNPYSLK